MADFEITTLELAFTDESTAYNAPLPRSLAIAESLKWIAGLESPQSITTPCDEGPFASIIVVPDSVHEAMMEELLCCLAAQDCDDFDVTIVVPDTQDTTSKSIESLADAFPTSFGNRVSILALPNSGDMNRMERLSAALAAAQGKYAAVIEQGDVPFAHLVSTCKNLALQQWGRIIRCTSLVQEWQAISSLNGDYVLRAVHAPQNSDKAPTPDSPKTACQNSPTAICFYPLFLARDFGIDFFTTDIDDLAKRTQYICGTSTVDDVCIIRRIWIEGELQQETSSDSSMRALEDEIAARDLAAMLAHKAKRRLFRK